MAPGYFPTSLHQLLEHAEHPAASCVLRNSAKPACESLRWPYMRVLIITVVLAALKLQLEVNTASRAFCIIAQSKRSNDCACSALNTPRRTTTFFRSKRRMGDSALLRWVWHRVVQSLL